MNKIEDVKPGQTFRVGAYGEYKMLRHCGDVDQPNRNQWGRATGGTHVERKCAVKVNRRHKGWRFSYVSFYPGQYVTIVE